MTFIATAAVAVPAGLVTRSVYRPVAIADGTLNRTWVELRMVKPEMVTVVEPRDSVTAVVDPRFVPVTVTVRAATVTVRGVKLVTVGGRITVNALVVVLPHLLTTWMPPVAAALGMTAVMVVALTMTKVAFFPLKVTFDVVRKLLPVIVTVCPTTPDVGPNDDTVGASSTLKTREVVPPLVLRLTGPCTA